MKYEENMAKAVGRYGKSNYNAYHDRKGGLEVSIRNTNLIRKERSFGKLKNLLIKLGISYFKYCRQNFEL